MNNHTLGVNKMSKTTKNGFNYREDSFFQFLNEHYYNDSNYETYKIILKSGFSQEKTNYLLLIELIRSINNLNYSLSFLYEKEL